MNFDIIIRDGVIVDGTGNPWFKADVGIRDGKIIAVGKLKSCSADEVIYAGELIVCPGFIDVHSHSDFTLLVNPKAESKIRQGVTTEVIGNCGFSAAPITSEHARNWVSKRLSRYGLKPTWSTFSEYLEALDKVGLSINVASLVGHSTIRMCVMDFEAREPSRDELSEMKSLVAEAMEAGAFGMSTGLVYPPGRYAKTNEIIELCKVVAKYGGVYASHIRGERETIVEAVLEAIRIGEESGVSVQISHHPAKIGGWGKSRETLKLIDEARSRGVDVTCDLHPYIAGSTGLSSILPPWAQEGGPRKIMERIKDPQTREEIKKDMIEEPIPGPGPCGLVKRGMWDKLFLVDCKRNKKYIGMSFAEIAAQMGVDPFTAYFNLIVEEEASGSILGFYYNEDDIRRVLLHPSSMIGSDGYALAPYGVLGQGRMHPRSYGTFPMVIRKYVKGASRSDLMYDEGIKILSLEEAIRKMTSLPAQKFGLLNRGIIRPGFWADIVIFSLKEISDTGTYLKPYQYPVGIKYVIVNGEIVIIEGEHTGKNAGRVLRHQAFKQIA
ncbi:MAG: D-aminoacylase [Candidatus Methanomethylicota archaeon]|uniref:D-aminoacylase n=2 Tax=Thermoproteota archaeon TaxID=2056631 RepID=A0A497EUM2_9CREN|nr:MAG: D-aminoacylase [Candidatus Verstraetearchaeota archaeon]